MSRLGILFVVGALVLVGCSVGQRGAPVTPLPSLAPTSCGGNVVWPPPSYPGPTDVIDAELHGSDRVSVANRSDTTWTVRVAPWVLLPCVGWIALGDTEGSRFSLAAGATAERRVSFDPGDEMRRIGVELWDHECDDRCTDELDAFISLEPPSAWRAARGRRAQEPDPHQARSSTSRLPPWAPGCAGRGGRDRPSWAASERSREDGTSSWPYLGTAGWARAQILPSRHERSLAVTPAPHPVAAVLNAVSAHPRVRFSMLADPVPHSTTRSLGDASMHEHNSASGEAAAGSERGGQAQPAHAHSVWWMVACCAPMLLIALAILLGVFGRS